jgi:hypothetical protein
VLDADIGSRVSVQSLASNVASSALVKPE